jgi:hypothetical protein
MVEVPFMSKRFAMKRFLGLSQEEIAENERMWREENIDQGTNLTAQAELRGAGITQSGISGDIDGLEGSTEPPEGMEGSDTDSITGLPAGGAPSAGTAPPPSA